MSSVQKQEEVRFRDHIRRLSVRNFPANNDGFDDELTELGKIDQRVRSNLDEFYTGSLGSSMAKNRFDDVKPNEQTLVRLRPISKRGDGTYINANYIDARDTMGVPFVYIATQAPMHNTVLDFWRMVYENDVAFIVMLCATKENGKMKSESYWPALGQVYDLGLLSIASLSENVRSDSVHRTLLLRTIRGDEKEIYHMQYLAWPDQGVPTTSIPLMEMIQAIGKSRRSVESPIVVHCSGGIGRTGVFVGMHIALAQFQLERTEISIMRIVRFMKLCRSGMVQRKDQYIYLYYSIQREMERMILSAERGVNLLDIRPRDRPIPAQTTANPALRPRLVGLPTSNGFMPVPSPHPLPHHEQSFWSHTTLANIVRSTGPEPSPHRVQRRSGCVGGAHGRQPSSRHTPSPSRRQHRDAVMDMAAMDEYLRRNPSMRARVEVPAGASRTNREAWQQPRDPEHIVSDMFGKGGKSYHTKCQSSTPPQTRRESAASASGDRGAGRGGSSPAPVFKPRPADAAAQTQLETELLRIQSINRQMRFVGGGDGNVTPTENHGGGATRAGGSPVAISQTPLSITRETPRTPRAPVMTARERSEPPIVDDLDYLRQRVVTRDDWRRL